MSSSTTSVSSPTKSHDSFFLRGFHVFIVPYGLKGAQTRLLVLERIAKESLATLCTAIPPEPNSCVVLSDLAYEKLLAHLGLRADSPILKRLHLVSPDWYVRT